MFWARIAERGGGASRTVPGVTCTTLPPKMALRGLDNAYITFDSFAVPRSSLLSRFCEVERGVATVPLGGQESCHGAGNRGAVFGDGT